MDQVLNLAFYNNDFFLTCPSENPRRLKVSTTCPRIRKLPVYWRVRRMSRECHAVSVADTCQTGIRETSRRVGASYASGLHLEVETRLLQGNSVLIF